LKKFQRYIDSKKEYDFLALCQVRTEKLATSTAGPREQGGIKGMLGDVKCAFYFLPMEFIQDKTIEKPDPADEQHEAMRPPTAEEKDHLEKLASNCHAIFYVPQGKSGPTLKGCVARREIYLYEQCVKYNTWIHIMDQHGCYGPSILRFCRRYNVDSTEIMKRVSLYMPKMNVGINIVAFEKKRGGCRSLVSNTRAFLSHKRSTGQGIAGRIYEGLRDEYYIFLDS